MSTRLSGRRLHLDVRFEPVVPGPIGELIQVVDYDGTRDAWYRPVDLEDAAILAQGGLRPAEGDPRTHQQVVYAVAMSVIERFERFLGRRFRWRGGQSLVLVPHAFEGRNAFFDPTRRAVLFGYYRADDRDPGPNLPGQVMFTCLSVDIVAHEVTHALMHRIRPNFSVATNADVFAWHEAFADLVALFHHFVFPEVVSDAVANGRGDLREGQGLLDLAREFGESTGRGAALRSAISDREATPERFRNATEPHERGACFVAGVFDAFLATYRRSIADLLRIATGGTGVLPPGHLHPDLVARVTTEAGNSADRFLGMVVRAFDFLPVVDVTFGDVVRAIVTADRALYPEDASQLRATLVECLRRRGIYPARISSLADEALSWPSPAVPLALPSTGFDLSTVIHSATQDLDPTSVAGAVQSEPGSDAGGESSSVTIGGGTEQFAPALTRWAQQHAIELGLDPGATTSLSGLHVVYRRAADGQPRPQIVVQFQQRRRDLEDQSVPEHLRVPMRAGTTLVTRIDGTVDRLVAKPLPLGNPATLAGLPPELLAIGQDHHDTGAERLAAIEAWLEGVKQQDALSAWTSTPALSRLTFAQLHSVAQNVPGR
ncbi:MAG: hypothetical protein ABJB98_05965 [Actinomycetota bacterium]